MRLQSENFGSVTGLNAVALALSGISCNDTEIQASDGQDSSTIFCVRIKLPHLRVAHRSVRHDSG